MRIAMIGQKGMPATYGGVEQHVHDLSVRLVQAGHTVTVYARQWYTHGQDTDIQGVEVIHVPSLKTKHFDTISHVLVSTAHAIKHNADIIHYHGVGPALLSWIPRLISPKTTVITTFHSIDRYHQKWGLLARIALRAGEWAACTFAHKTITISRGLQHYCLNEFNKKTAYIPNAVQSDTAHEPGSVIKEFGLEDHTYVVMVSRLVPHKGAHLLVEAFSNLKKTHRDDPEIRNLKLAIVGDSVYTNDYVQSLHSLASACNDIVFTGFQSGATIKALYKHARVLVHPSINEGLPITVLQAMGYGTPVLVSNIPEHIELIKDDRCVFHENDVSAIEQSLSEFLRLSSEDLQAIVLNNLQTVQKHYSWDTIMPRILELYKFQYHSPLENPTISSIPSKSISTTPTSMPGSSNAE